MGLHKASKPKQKIKQTIKSNIKSNIKSKKSSLKGTLESQVKALREKILKDNRAKKYANLFKNQLNKFIEKTRKANFKEVGIRAMKEIRYYLRQILRSQKPRQYQKLSAELTDRLNILKQNLDIKKSNDKIYIVRRGDTPNSIIRKHLSTNFRTKPFRFWIAYAAFQTSRVQPNSKADRMHRLYRGETVNITHLKKKYKEFLQKFSKTNQKITKTITTKVKKAATKQKLDQKMMRAYSIKIAEAYIQAKPNAPYLKYLKKWVARHKKRLKGQGVKFQKLAPVMANIAHKKPVLNNNKEKTPTKTRTGLLSLLPNKPALKTLKHQTIQNLDKAKTAAVITAVDTLQNKLIPLIRSKSLPQVTAYHQQITKAITQLQKNQKAPTGLIQRLKVLQKTALLLKTKIIGPQPAQKGQVIFDQRYGLILGCIKSVDANGNAQMEWFTPPRKLNRNHSGPQATLALSSTFQKTKANKNKNGIDPKSQNSRSLYLQKYKSFFKSQIFGKKTLSATDFWDSQTQKSSLPTGFRLATLKPQAKTIIKNGKEIKTFKTIAALPKINTDYQRLIQEAHKQLQKDLRKSAPAALRFNMHALLEDSLHKLQHHQKLYNNWKTDVLKASLASGMSARLKSWRGKFSAESIHPDINKKYLITIKRLQKRIKDLKTLIPLIGHYKRNPQNPLGIQTNNSPLSPQAKKRLNQIGINTKDPLIKQILLQHNQGPLSKLKPQQILANTIKNAKTTMSAAISHVDKNKRDYQQFMITYRQTLHTFQNQIVSIKVVAGKNKKNKTSYQSIQTIDGKPSPTAILLANLRGIQAAIGTTPQMVKKHKSIFQAIQKISTCINAKNYSQISAQLQIIQNDPRAQAIIKKFKIQFPGTKTIQSEAQRLKKVETAISKTDLAKKIQDLKKYYQQIIDNRDALSLSKISQGVLNILDSDSFWAMAAAGLITGGVGSLVLRAGGTAIGKFALATRAGQLIANSQRISSLLGVIGAGATFHTVNNTLLHGVQAATNTKQHIDWSSIGYLKSIIFMGAFKKIHSVSQLIKGSPYIRLATSQIGAVGTFTAFEAGMNKYNTGKWQLAKAFNNSLQMQIALMLTHGVGKLTASNQRKLQNLQQKAKDIEYNLNRYETKIQNSTNPKEIVRLNRAKNKATIESHKIINKTLRIEQEIQLQALQNLNKAASKGKINANEHKQQKTQITKKIQELNNAIQQNNAIINNHSLTYGGNRILSALSLGKLGKSFRASQLRPGNELIIDTPSGRLTAKVEAGPRKGILNLKITENGTTTTYSLDSPLTPGKKVTLFHGNFNTRTFEITNVGLKRSSIKPDQYILRQATHSIRQSGKSKTSPFQKNFQKRFDKAKNFDPSKVKLKLNTREHGAKIAETHTKHLKEGQIVTLRSNNAIIQLKIKRPINQQGTQKYTTEVIHTAGTTPKRLNKGDILIFTEQPIKPNSTINFQYQNTKHSSKKSKLEFTPTEIRIKSPSTKQRTKERTRQQRSAKKSARQQAKERTREHGNLTDTLESNSMKKGDTIFIENEYGKLKIKITEQTPKGSIIKVISSTSRGFQTNTTLLLPKQTIKNGQQITIIGKHKKEVIKLEVTIKELRYKKNK